MSFIFKEPPPDVLKHLLKVQGEKKAERGISQFSQLQTIFSIIREHKQMKESKKDKQ